MVTCTKCGQTKPKSRFARDSRKKSGRKAWCLDCTNVATKAWLDKNPDARKKYWRRMADHRRANPEHYKNADLKKHYGITLEFFNEMWSRQNGQCAICEAPLAPGQKGHAVDHCHTTGTVRGLLCPSCNLGIGKFRDNPELLRSAANYLEATNDPSVVAA